MHKNLLHWASWLIYSIPPGTIDRIGNRQRLWNHLELHNILGEHWLHIHFQECCRLLLDKLPAERSRNRELDESPGRIRLPDHNRLITPEWRERSSGILLPPHKEGNLLLVPMKKKELKIKLELQKT